MTRTALLPMPGDPIILRHFLNNFTNVWAHEVDSLRVCLNIDHRVSSEIKEYDIKMLEETPKVKFIVVEEMLFQGAALRELLKTVVEDTIMSVEDDTVVIDHNMVDRCFRKIESGEADVIGSPRFSCSQEILDRSAEKYGLDYSGYGDKGPNLWPNFFFIKTKDLLNTDLHFEPKGWEAGEYCKELDVTFKEVQSADVFVWLCMQLRAKGLKFSEVPQFHSHPDDLLDMAMGRNLGERSVPWIHIGSLTMTAEDLLIGNDIGNHKNTPNTEFEKKELERRYAWLKVFADKVDVHEIEHIKRLYIERMNKFIMRFGLSQNNISNLMEVYRRFITW